MKQTQRSFNSTLPPPSQPMKRGGRIKPKGRRGTRNQKALNAAYEIAKERSGGRCQWCFENEATEVHHLHSRGSAADKREDASNLAHLCKDCHEHWQDKGATFRQLYAAENPYFAAIYCDALDVMKVGKAVPR